MAAASPHEELLADGIAVIGMAGRFPGAPTVEDFWQNLRAGKESIAFFTEEELAAAGVPERERTDPAYVPAKGALEDIAGFDAGYFGMSPREAALVDPQQRLFLEICVEALERTGVVVAEGTDRIGVFAGTSKNTYLFFNLLSHAELRRSPKALQTLISNDKDYLSTRVSYKLGLRGPSLTVQTACSSSLVALHLACQSLLSGECELALAGGVAVDAPHRAGYVYEPGGIFSPDGHCRPFDASARGTVFGQGAGAVLLKRLGGALADGDEIRAIVRGSAINNDGADKVGFTAPSVSGQADVIAEALMTAGVEADTVSYVETHGTATPLGDPIEIEALTRAFRRWSDREAFCRIGSVKANVGHLNAAAGIAGLIKTVLALEHRELPPTPHFERPNPKIPFAGSPFVVNDRLTPWESDGCPRRAGVSSFGIGGTNAHVVLEEAPPAPAADPGTRFQLIPVAARTPAALTAAARRLGEALGACGDDELADVAWTQQTGRRAHQHRTAVVCSTAAEGARALAAAARRPARQPARERPTVAFLFAGQGSQYVGMARELHEHEPLFREQFEACCEDLRAAGAHDPRDLVLRARQSDSAATELARRTEVAQPALFAVEYALAELWRSWGVEPAALVGHSLGEIVAACIGGVLRRSGAAQLVAERARLVAAQPRGAMLAVPRPAGELAALLAGGLELAALNAPDLTVLTGAEDAIEQARAELAEQGVKARRLHTSHAFHSASMEAAMAPLAACAASIERRPPRLRIASNVSGDWLTDEEAVDPAYWARQLRSPVRFGDDVGALLSSGVTALLEIGPGGTLTQLTRRHPAWSEQHTLARSLPDHAEGEDLDRETMLTALGRLWTAGVQPRWEALHQGARRRIVVLPTYPFERARHWIDPAPLPDAAGAAAPGPFTPAGPLASPPAAAPSPPPAPPAPADAAARVAAVFESLLGVGGVGGQDDFFDLGGSSLIGVDLVARLRDVLGVDLPLGAVFRNPRPDDIAALAAGVANGEAEPDGAGDLAREDIWIPGDVGSTRSLRPAHSRPGDVLLTGATGFLGSFLLRELLDQATGRVHCLVRADDPELGLERLRRGLSFYDLLEGADLDRVVAVPGDLSRDRLGLEIERYEELSATVGSVLHNGAKVSFLEPYGLLRRTNVRGTREVLRFASHGALKPVGHVSSIAVFDCDALEDVRIAHEDDDLTGAAGFHGGYDESKWVSEQVVELARRRGVPVTIYRPGNIAGDSRSGAVSDGHLVSAMLKGCVALGVAPDTDELVDVVPVDYVSRALVALSRSEELPNRTFHLVNPTATRWSEIVGHLNATGYRVSLVPPEEWRAAIRTAAHEDNPLRVFLPMLEERALFSGRRYRCERTVEALSGTGIVCPPLDAPLIATYVRALVARGELRPPGPASEPLAPVGSGRA